MKSKSIVPRSVAVLPSVTRAELIARADLTFRVFDDLVVADADLHQSLLNGSLIRNCQFDRVRISRCDLEQAQVIKSRFTNVDFTNIQLTSTQFNNSTFIGCKFDSALIHECTWTQSVFEGCSFRQAVLHNSVFDKCLFTSNDYKGGSIQLNIYRDSTLKNMVLGDCTFLNQIMVGCTYTNVRVNAESIGSIYGLTENDLRSFDLVYLGQNVSSVNAPLGLIDSLESDYEGRRWYFMKEMVRLNFGRVPAASGLDCCLVAVLWPSTVGAHLRGGDIAFLELVILEMYRQKKLPALTAITFPERIRVFCNSKRGGQESQANIQRLRQLGNQLGILLLEMLPELLTSLGTDTPERKDAPVLAQLTFVKKPSIPVETFLNDLVTASGFSATLRTFMLKEKEGSYLLFLQTTILTLSALRVALWLINGCAFQLIELKSRVEVIKRKKSPKIVQQRVLMPEQNIPPWVPLIMQNIFGRLTTGPSNLTSLAEDFGTDNLKMIRVTRSGAMGRKKGKLNRKG